VIEIHPSAVCLDLGPKIGTATGLLFLMGTTASHAHRTLFHIRQRELEGVLTVNFQLSITAETYGLSGALI